MDLTNTIEGVLGIIEKMCIKVYSDNSYTEAKLLDTLFVQLNPEKYSIKKNVNFCEGQPVGASGGELKFNKIEPEEVNFEFLFDSTGAIPPVKSENKIADTLSPTVVNPLGEPESIEEVVENFKERLIGYLGDSHQTAFLELIWGGYHFQCRTKSLEVEYLLFGRNGRPLRAKVKCTFKGTTTYTMMVKKQGKKSPDVTHEVEFKMNESLPNKANTIYQNSTYYTDVAKANHLLSFRHIKQGTKIYFPPVK